MKKVAHLGSEKMKVVFTVEVKQIIFGGVAYSEFDGAVLSVCFERGGRLASSTDRLFNADKSNANTLDVNQPLSLAVTLYRDGSGALQEKTGTLILRHLKRSKSLGTSGYIAIGSVALSLHRLVVELAEGGPKDKLFTVGGTEIIISTRLSLHQGAFGWHEDDESASIVSGRSDFSDASAGSP